MRVGWMDGWPLMVRANGEWPSERSVVYARRKTITIHDPVFKNGPVLHSPLRRLTNAATRGRLVPPSEGQAGVGPCSHQRRGAGGRSESLAQSRTAHRLPALTAKAKRVVQCRAERGPPVRSRSNTHHGRRHLEPGRRWVLQPAMF